MRARCQSSFRPSLSASQRASPSAIPSAGPAQMRRCRAWNICNESVSWQMRSPQYLRFQHLILHHANGCTSIVIPIYNAAFRRVHRVISTLPYHARAFLLARFKRECRVNLSILSLAPTGGMSSGSVLSCSFRWRSRRHIDDLLKYQILRSLQLINGSDLFGMFNRSDRRALLQKFGVIRGIGLKVE